MKKACAAGGAALLLAGGILIAAQMRSDLLHAWFGVNFPWALLLTAISFLALAAALLYRSSTAMLITASITAGTALQAYHDLRALTLPVTFLWPLVPALAGLWTAFSQRKTGGHPAGWYLAGIALLAAAAFYAMTAANLNMNLTWGFLMLLAGTFFLAHSRTSQI